MSILMSIPTLNIKPSWLIEIECSSLPWKSPTISRETNISHSTVTSTEASTMVDRPSKEKCKKGRDSTASRRSMREMMLSSASNHLNTVSFIPPLINLYRTRRRASFGPQVGAIGEADRVWGEHPIWTGEFPRWCDRDHSQEGRSRIYGADDIRHGWGWIRTGWWSITKWQCTSYKH